MSLSQAVREEREKRKRAAFVRREQDILNVAESLMAEQGVRTISVDVIAARAGIGKGTIYKHFESKADVLIAIVVRHYTMLTELLVRMADPAQALTDWMEAQLHAPARARLIHELTRIVSSDPQAMHRVRDARDRMRRRLTQVLSGHSAGVADPMDRALWLEAIVHGALQEMDSPLHHADFDTERYIDSVLRAVAVVHEKMKAKKADQRLTYL